MSTVEARVDIITNALLHLPVSGAALHLAARQIELALRQAGVVNEQLEPALRPFADAVFNDNGDMTVNFSAVKHDDFVAAYLALRKAGR